MSGSTGDMGNLLKQAQKMQQELDRVRDELRSQRVEGEAAGGLVKVTVTGERRVLNLHIDPVILENGDAQRVEQTVLAAISDGMDKAEALREKSLSRITGGMTLPGLF